MDKCCGTCRWGYVPTRRPGSIVCVSPRPNSEDFKWRPIMSPADGATCPAYSPDAKPATKANEVMVLREALERIAKPTYGTELTDTDEERAKHYWTMLQVMQHIARKALNETNHEPDPL